MNPTVFRAIFELFPEVAQRVVDRHGPVFTEEGFTDVLGGVFSRIKPSKFTAPPHSHKELGTDLSKALRGGFVIG